MGTPHPRGFWARLAHARSGVAAIEFALILPVMLVLFMGTFEVTEIVMADLKLTAAAETVADLVSQTDLGITVKQLDLNNYTTAATQVLTPLPASNGATQLLKVAYASVTFTNSSGTLTPVIDWHYEVNGATPITLATQTSPNASNIPNNQNNQLVDQFATSTADSVIVVNVQYTYSSPTSYVLNLGPYTLSEWAFNRPRNVNCVVAWLNANGVCP